MFSKFAFGSCTEFLMKLFRIYEKRRQVRYLSCFFLNVSEISALRSISSNSFKLILKIFYLFPTEIFLQFSQNLRKSYYSRAIAGCG